MANPLQNKPVEQEIVVASGMIPRSPVPIVSNSSGSTQVPVLQAKSKDVPSETGVVTMAYTSAMSSNLSQLAELAASQAPSQTGHFLPTVPHFQQQGSLNPGLVGGTKYIIPGQNVPLPLGPQQTQIPIGSPITQAQNQNVPFPTNIPPPFQKGSIIQLKSGDLKRVEDLKTEDFVHSVNLCPELKLETSTVISIRKNDEVGMSLIGFSINSTKSQVTLSCAVEHPFFECDKGWSSCVPDKSQQKFALQCSQLGVGDVCIFLSPNTTPATVPGTLPSILQPQVTTGRPQTQLVSVAAPEQVQQSTGLNQVNIQVEDPASTAAVVVNAITQKHVPSSIAVPAQSQVLPAIQTSGLPVTTPSQFSTPTAIQAGSTLIYDPQFGFLRPHSFSNQQVIGTTIDGKTVPVQGALPPFYQTVPASLVTSLSTTTVTQSPSIPATVGNGLLVTAVGIVPGQQGVRMGQPGMVYASQLSEMAQKQEHDTNSSLPVINASVEQQPDTETDVDPPESKRPKAEGQ